MSVLPDPRTVLRQYQFASAPANLRPFSGGGGLSGADLYRFRVGEQEYGLRRWPSEQPTLERLGFIHSVLGFACQQGFTRLPLPIPVPSGATFVQLGNRFWEVVPWLPGQANYLAAPTRGKLCQAMGMLAEFHLAVARFADTAGKSGVAPAVLKRLEMLGKLGAGGMTLTQAAVQDRPHPLFQEQAQRILRLFPRAKRHIATGLEKARAVTVPLQPCIRDVWHAHILYTGEQVSGIIDFGALDVDTIATDVARLLGSLAGDRLEERQAGLQAYEEIRGLRDQESMLVAVLDQSGTLLAGMNWLRWLYVEQRQFENLALVQERLDEVVKRLGFLVNLLAI